MNRTRLLAPLALALLLTGCQLTITVDPFPDAEEVDVGTDPNQPLTTFTLAAGESRAFELSAAGLDDRDLIYTELDENLELVLYSAQGGAYASSTSPQYFAAGTAATTALSTEGVSVNVNCRGACVIRETGVDRYFAEVTNRSGGPVEVAFYAYADDYQDTGEPGNDALGGAVLLGSGESGAIETLGDEDYYRVNTPGRLTLASTSAVNVRAELRNEAGELEETLVPGGPSVRALAGDYVVVFAQNDRRAAASAASLYNLSLE